MTGVALDSIEQADQVTMVTTRPPSLLSHPITSFSKGDAAKIILIIRLQLTHHSTAVPLLALPS